MAWVPRVLITLEMTTKLKRLHPGPFQWTWGETSKETNVSFSPKCFLSHTLSRYIPRAWL